MKNLLLAAVFMLGLSFQANAVCTDCRTDVRINQAVAEMAAPGEDDPALSTMVLKVEGIVGNETQAKRVRKTIKALEGIANVDACTQSGTVTVTYNKAKLGCCSRIHTQLEQNGIQYAMVSNQEQGGNCAGRATQGQQQQQQQGCSRQRQQGCQGSQGTQGTQQGNRPASCCPGNRRNS